MVLQLDSCQVGLLIPKSLILPAMLDWAYICPGSGPEGALVEDPALLQCSPPTIPRAHMGQAALYDQLADV